MARIQQSMPLHQIIDSSPLAAQTNPNTTNTMGSLSSVNNAEAPIRDDSFGNCSAYAMEDAEDTENVDDTGKTPLQPHLGNSLLVNIKAPLLQALKTQISSFLY